MAGNTVRRTSGLVVLVASDNHHKRGRNTGRLCAACSSLWTMEYKPGDPPRVFRNDVEEPNALLDWTGNNAAVECCAEQAASGVPRRP